MKQDQTYNNKGGLLHIYKVVVILTTLSGYSLATNVQRSCITPKDQYGRSFLIIESSSGKMLSDSISFESDFELGNSVAYLKKIQNILRSKGSDLVLLPVPPDGLIYADEFDLVSAAKTSVNLASYSVSKARIKFRKMIGALNSNGIITFSILDPALRNKNGFFFKRDHHWTPEGAKISARFIASVLSNSSLSVTSLSKKQIYFDGENEQKGSYAIRAEACGWNFPNETYPKVRLEDSNAGLLDDIGSFVLLIGNSYSSDYFSNYLSESLGEEIVNNGIPAGGLTDSFIDYFIRPSNHTRFPKYVIWQFTAGQDGLNHPSFYREAIASLYDQCSDARALLSRELDIPQSTIQDVTLKIPYNLSAGGLDYFINLQFDDVTTRRFTYFLSYGEYQEGIQIHRNDRIRNNGSFNFALSPDAKDPLSEIRIAFPERVMGKLKVNLCKSGIS